jgi:ketosteroid isomerase-like protein
MDPVEELLTIEKIRQVKYRYLRCVDTKLWDEIGDTFTEDAVVDYGTQAFGKPLKMSGRDEIVKFFRTSVGPDILTVHAAGQPEITIDAGGDTASGIWSFTDTVLATKYRVVIAGAAFYHDQYHRDADGKWRISRTSYQRTYESMVSLDDTPSFKIIAQLDTAHLNAD